VKYLAQIVQATMNVMATFPNQQQVKTKDLFQFYYTTVFFLVTKKLSVDIM
jgi:hypothetical protein